MARVLFVNPNFEDYAADGLFHGLRSLLGTDAVDFPKAEYLYDTASPATLGRIRGGGFTLYGLLPDLPVDRDHCLDRALKGEFDLIVFGDIWRTFGLFTEWGPQLADAGRPMAILDGSDRVEPYPFAGVWWRRRAWWFLPRAHTRGVYFKREVTPWTRWFRSYLTLPPPLNRRLLPDLRPLAFSVPESAITLDSPEKTQEFPAHIVDAELASRLGRTGTGYAFDTEAGYVDDLRRSRFGVTTKREGWDALRHYEIAAAGTVPCFRDLEDKPPPTAPYGLDPSNSISYRSANELLDRVRALTADEYDDLRTGALRWARANSTEERARWFLAQFGL